MIICVFDHRGSSASRPQPSSTPFIQGKISWSVTVIPRAWIGMAVGTHLLARSYGVNLAARGKKSRSRQLIYTKEGLQRLVGYTIWNWCCTGMSLPSMPCMRDVVEGCCISGSSAFRSQGTHVLHVMCVSLPSHASHYYHTSGTAPFVEILFERQLLQPLPQGTRYNRPSQPIWSCPQL